MRVLVISASAQGTVMISWILFLDVFCSSGTPSTHEFDRVTEYYLSR